MHLHDGFYLDSVMRDIEAFLSHSQEKVNGIVFIKLHPYRFDLEGIISENDLLSDESSRYGEMNANWSAEDIKGFIKVTALYRW